MASTTGHTVKAFDEDLRQLRALVSEMGGLAETALADAMTALGRRDAEGASAVVESDRRIDRIEAEIERLALRILALRAPMADDLRDVIAALKISGVIERMGDYAKNIARRVPLLTEARAIEALSVLPAMGRAVAEMMREAFDAYAARDPAAAIAVAESDRVVDDFYNSLFRALLTHMMEAPHTITAAAHLLFIAKNLERIGDHATNVAEIVHFASTGIAMADRGRGLDALDAPKGE